MAGKAVQRRPLLILRDPLHLQSGNQFYFQRLFLTNSVSQFQNPTDFSESSPLMPPSNYRPNCHLSLSAMVDCWAHLGINPYAHLDVAATPIFRLFLGVAEDLFQSLTLLESALAIYDHWQRVDDSELVIWVAVWGGWETWQWDDEGSDGDWSHQGRGCLGHWAIVR